jgi:hypothetical protein
MPACLKAIMVNPEQSHVDGPAEPKEYRSPICFRAKRSAIPALPLTLLANFAADNEFF